MKFIILFFLFFSGCVNNLQLSGKLQFDNRGGNSEYLITSNQSDKIFARSKISNLYLRDPYKTPDYTETTLEYLFW